MTEKEILDMVSEKIDSFNSSLLKLENTAISYTEKYDSYNARNLLDSDILKEKMKTAVILATNIDV